RRGQGETAGGEADPGDDAAGEGEELATRQAHRALLVQDQAQSQIARATRATPSGTCTDTSTAGPMPTWAVVSTPRAVEPRASHTRRARRGSSRPTAPVNIDGSTSTRAVIEGRSKAAQRPWRKEEIEIGCRTKRIACGMASRRKTQRVAVRAVEGRAAGGARAVVAMASTLWTGREPDHPMG